MEKQKIVKKLKEVKEKWSIVESTLHTKLDYFGAVMVAKVRNENLEDVLAEMCIEDFTQPDYEEYEKPPAGTSLWKRLTWDPEEEWARNYVPTPESVNLVTTPDFFKRVDLTGADDIA